ncbi:MAG: hypothetical protein DWQ19_09965 [Crenarchaeota archaeon]|nr:MAG: hypothetical protein DWQ19_09965 [Thermoproteota archaeon]
MPKNPIYETPVEYKFHPDFNDPKLVEIIMGEMPDKEQFDKDFQRIRALDKRKIKVHVRPTYMAPLLTPEQEIYLFKKYNYLKYQAAELQKELTTSRKPKFRRLLLQAEEIRKLIAACNYRLAPKIAKRCKGYLTMSEALTEAYFKVWYTVPKFDVSTKYKFSTYCVWAIRNHFAQAYNKDHKRVARYKTGGVLNDFHFLDDNFDRYEDFTEEVAEKEEQEKCVVVSKKILKILRDMEKDPVGKRRAYAVRHYYGLLKSMPKTLREIGDDINVTKERVRQLRASGLDYIRHKLEENGVESPYEDIDVPEESYNFYDIVSSMEELVNTS